MIIHSNSSLRSSLGLRPRLANAPPYPRRRFAIQNQLSNAGLTPKGKPRQLKKQGTIERGMRRASTFLATQAKAVLNLEDKLGGIRRTSQSKIMLNTRESKAIIVNTEAKVASQTENFFNENQDAKHLRDVLEDLQGKSGDGMSAEDGKEKVREAKNLILIQNTKLSKKILTPLTTTILTVPPAHHRSHEGH